MNKDEIKYIMAIIRPAIWALYGRQQLKLSAYSETDIHYFSDIVSGWFEVDSINREDYFKVEIKEDVVISLAIGELNV